MCACGVERGGGAFRVGRNRVIGEFGEIDFNSERRAGSGSLVKFRCFDGIGECRSGFQGRGVVRRKGFGVS